MCVCVYEAASHLFSNKAQDDSVVMAPVLMNTDVGGNVIYNININTMKIEDNQKIGKIQYILEDIIEADILPIQKKEEV